MLVGLHGQKYSGKDTSADRLKVLFLDLEWEVLSFAQKLKEFGAAALGISLEEFERLKLRQGDAQLWIMEKNEDGDWNPTLTGLSIRNHQQLIGTEAAQRIFWQTFWVDLILPKPEDAFIEVGPPPGTKHFTNVAIRGIWKELYHKDKNLVITDCRFVHETQRIHSLGGEIWYIDSGTRNVDGHLSEALLPEGIIDVHIDNTIRDDNFASLDYQLVTAAAKIFKEEGRNGN